MRVLLVTNELGLRGGERQVALLAEGLRARGSEIALVSPKEAALRSGFPGEVLDAPMANSLDPRGALALRAAAQRFQPHLVHAFSSRAHSLCRAARLEAPLVVTRSVAFTAGRSGLGRSKYRGGVAAFIAVSGAVRSALLEAGAEDARVELIPPGVPPRVPDREAGARLRAELGTTLVIGAVGALERAKGFDVLLDALPVIRARGLEAGVMILGEGGELASLERQAAALGVKVRIRRDPTVEALLGGADLLCSPSRSEGFGMVVVEALSAGVPVVAADSGGVRESLRDGVDGLLVPPDDSQALATALVRMHRDERLRASLVESGLLRATGFSVERMVERTWALYQRVIEAQARSSSGP